jgi:DNA-binding IclR family transcriptional regulator
MPRTGQPSRGRIPSAERLLAVLDLLAEAGTLGTNEIARRLGMSASTVSRQLGTLLQAELIEFVEESRQYRLGIRLVQLGNAVLARLDVRTSARPHLVRLVDAVGDTATLSVPAGRDALTIDFVPSERYVQGATRLGRPSIGHATAAGKVMLAFTGGRPAPQLAAFTERTITEPEALERELERVRQRGWADAFEEREQGLNAIAAPIFASDGELAAVIALQGPIPRFGRASAKKALPQLLSCAARISAELGYRASG